MKYLRLILLAAALHGGCHTGSAQEIAPRQITVSRTKTVHLIFPSAITYVDLGSSLITAGKAPSSENVLRVKATTDSWQGGETNFTVICHNGTFHSFVVSYEENPRELNILLPAGESVSLNSRIEGEDPSRVHYFMELAEDISKASGFSGNGARSAGITFSLGDIFVRDNLIYITTMIENRSSLQYEVDEITFSLSERTGGKRRSSQRVECTPLESRAERVIPALTARCVQVHVFRSFSFSKNKVLEASLREKGGERHLKFIVTRNDFQKIRQL